MHWHAPASQQSMPSVAFGLGAETCVPCCVAAPEAALATSFSLDVACSWQSALPAGRGDDIAAEWLS